MAQSISTDSLLPWKAIDGGIGFGPLIPEFPSHRHMGSQSHRSQTDIGKSDNDLQDLQMGCFQYFSVDVSVQLCMAFVNAYHLVALARSSQFKCKVYYRTAPTCGEQPLVWMTGIVVHKSHCRWWNLAFSSALVFRLISSSVHGASVRLRNGDFSCSRLMVIPLRSTLNGASFRSRNRANHIFLIM